LHVRSRKEWPNILRRTKTEKSCKIRKHIYKRIKRDGKKKREREGWGGQRRWALRNSVGCHVSAATSLDWPTHRHVQVWPAHLRQRWQCWWLWSHSVHRVPVSAGAQRGAAPKFDLVSTFTSDPPTHPRGGPKKTYNGCPQPFPWSARSLARSPDARAMPARKKTGAAPPRMEGQVHLSGNTQYVCALGRIGVILGEGDDQPAKNMESRSLTQKGNQTQFFHRMPGIQRSPAVYDLQHLREYKSCRIWAGQSRRPPYKSCRIWAS